MITLWVKFQSMLFHQKHLCMTENGLKKATKSKVDLKKLKKIKIEDALIKILSSPNHSNKSWITNQYDQSVMCDTAIKSGSDAAVIRIHNKDKAIAVSVDYRRIIVNHILLLVENK